MARLQVAAFYKLPDPPLHDAGLGHSGDGGAQAHDGLALHQQVVGALSGGLAWMLGWPAAQARQLELASALHDIGKRFIDLQVVNKPGPLSDDERALMQLHPELGWLHLKSAAPSPVNELAALIAVEHHERWDGHGYPARKTGQAISLPSRITSLCDAYAARRERRSYKAGEAHDHAMAALISGEAAGKAFDPALVEAFACVDLHMSRIFDVYAAAARGGTADSVPAKGYT